MKIPFANWSWQEPPTNRKSKFDTNYLLGSPTGLAPKGTKKDRILGRKLSMPPQVVVSLSRTKENVLP